MPTCMYFNDLNMSYQPFTRDVLPYCIDYRDKGCYIEMVKKTLLLWVVTSRTLAASTWKLSWELAAFTLCLSKKHVSVCYFQ